MRLLVVNPNATQAMTDTIAATAQSAVGDRVVVTALTNRDGPPAIQGAADGEAAVPGVLRLLADHGAVADAAVIACFDDTGLAAARDAAPFPVVGLGQAAFHTACLFGPRFSVVTTLAVSVPVIEANIAAYGLTDRCARVRASGVPVLDLEHAPGPAAAQVGAEILRAVAEDTPQAVVLGCAGMTAILPALPRPPGVALIDCTVAAAMLACAAARLARA